MLRAATTAIMSAREQQPDARKGENLAERSEHTIVLFDSTRVNSNERKCAKIHVCKMQTHNLHRMRNIEAKSDRKSGLLRG